MDFNLLKYLFLIGLVLNKIEFLNSETTFGLRDVFDGCNFQGKESIKSGNLNCTKLPIPNLWDEEANKRCVKEYISGCQSSKIQEFCHLGAEDQLNEQNARCKPLEKEYEYGMDFYVLCCNVCAKGKETYLKKQSCKRDLPLNASLPEIFVQTEFENCCTSKATKGLRSLDAFDDDDDVDICTKFGCEHFCKELDVDKAICECRKGYQLDKNGRKCNDINECQLPNECLPDQKCINLIGTYECVEILTSSNHSSNESRNLSLRKSLDDINNKLDELTIQCKNDSYYDPHRNSCIEIVDKYDNFCLDEKCDTRTDELLAKTKLCKTGFVKHEEGFCEDLDECVNPKICDKDQICVNRLGDFDCLAPNATIICDTGFIKNGQSCNDINECLDNKCDKNQKCINLLGDYKCVDRPKSESSLLADNSSLQSRDSNSQMQPNSTNDKQCEPGQIKNDEGNCENIDFCAKNPNVCDRNEKCINSLGSHKCECNEGFKKNEKNNKCEDIDECSTGDNLCMEHSSICKNLEGSYECTCKSGYKKNPNEMEKDCVNIDECEEKLHNCLHGCYDIPGSFECTCKDGFELHTDNKTCIEKDLCKDKNFCDGICEKKNEGDYICKKCQYGFEIDQKRQICVAIDECKKEVCPSGETCINLKNGKSQCVNLKCPDDYEENFKENICIKKHPIEKDRKQALALSKKVLVLPLKNLTEDQPLTIHSFKNSEDLDLKDVEFKINVSNLVKDEFSADETYFKLENQNLVKVRPIKKEQDFIIEINVIYKKIKLHTSELIVFVV